MLPLIEKCGIPLSVTRVLSISNRPDSLTRVPQWWLKASAAHPTAQHLVCAASSKGACHPEIKRTLYFVKRVIPKVIKQQVRAVVSGCEVCHSVDPAPVK